MKSHKKVMRQSWDSHGAVMRQSWDSHETVMRQSWDIYETVMRQSWDSHERVMRKSWDSHKIVMSQSWDSHEKVYYPTPFAGFADISVLVCSIRYGFLATGWPPLLLGAPKFGIFDNPPVCPVFGLEENNIFLDYGGTWVFSWVVQYFRLIR